MKLRQVAFTLSLSAALLTPSILKAADMKFGIVNVQDVLDTIDDGKKAKSQLEKSVMDRKKELDDKQREYKKLDEAYEKQKLILSAAALDEKRKELENKKSDLQRIFMTAQTDTQKQEMELTGSIIKKIRAVVEKLGQSGGYSVVLEKSEGGVIYNKDAMDMTKQVIEEYNKAYKK